MILGGMAFSIFKSVHDNLTNIDSTEDISLKIFISPSADKPIAGNVAKENLFKHNSVIT